ncbi:hypothetical protein BGZ61DRAFT_536389 [Ilyonectria robusta]|uniref:uncharacterized protein n=1 Tax=Ilyonectria robusta TaxID=1079257 RepID=UPI001E8EC9AD|nr:uncharacterized protein BGZ61DRAFT_536389 [Ilyonectria robusta]KAH8675103.1 hypothetical protein BGZ61DRAFT_536389 [Ilyonectria robusta]
MRKLVPPRVGDEIFPRWVHAFKLYTYSRKKDLAGEVNQFRERVHLLRDMCSEIKTGSQLLEASAAIFKLTSLTEHESHLTRAQFEDLRKQMSEMDQKGWTDHDDITHGDRLSQSSSESEFEALHAVQKPREATETNETNGILLRNRRQPLAEQVMALVNSNYIIDATVLVENSTKPGGQRFNQAPANVQYYPGRVKLDTGSEADLASLQYLLDAGLNKDDLTPIPVANQCQVEGIGGALFTPQFEVELRWFRHGEPRTNKDRFLVVDQAPFDLLLSSRRFAQEARLISLPLMRRRKPREVIAKELQEEKKRIEAAKALEEEKYQQERVRRMEMGRVSTIHTTHDDNIV